MRDQFWTLPLQELSDEEWESLCDGCGKCCLHKLQDEDDGQLYYTAVACAQLDLDNCRCNNYSTRATLVPECLDVKVSYQDPKQNLAHLPTTCAYRVRAENHELPAWHPLICGEKRSIHSQNHSVRGKVLSAVNVHEDEFEDHIISWIEL
ncbi:MAG: YcgN family cysteine cluster protein [Pseudomonadales bacterium]